jgi:hypothetical protein
MGTVAKILDPVVKRAGANMKKYKRKGQISIGSISVERGKKISERSSTSCQKQEWRCQ